MSEICELEDFDKDCCINCFNGFPHYGCPKQEEEIKKLRELKHKRAEADRKKVYNEGYKQGQAAGKDKALKELEEHLEPRLKWENDIYTLAIRQCIELIEKLREYNE